MVWPESSSPRLYTSSFCDAEFRAKGAVTVMKQYIRPLGLFGSAILADYGK